MLVTVMDRRLSTSKINRDVFVEGIAIEELLLDHFPLVAERNAEFLVTLPTTAPENHYGGTWSTLHVVEVQKGLN